MAIEEKIHELMAVTDQLNDLLRQETKLLRQRQLTDIEPLQESKLALGRLYAGLCTQLRDAGSAMADLDPDLQAGLKEKAGVFQALARENRDCLSAARQINRRVIEAVAQAVLEADPHPEIYAGDGKMNDKSPQATPHMSLNQLA